MSRVKKIALLVVLFAMFIAFVRWLTFDPTAPRYIVAKSIAVTSGDTSLSYNFLSPDPFEGGKMWITVHATNTWHQYFFDLKNQTILGELVNANAVFLNRDQTKVLCMQRAKANVFQTAVTTLLGRVLPGNRTLAYRASHARDDYETFWAVDLQRNSATRLGQLYQFPGAGATFQPSPGFRYGFEKSTGSFNEPEIFFCDIEHNIFQRRVIDGFPVGWWSDTCVLMKATNNDLVLYDVEAQKTSPLLSLQQMKEFYTNAGLTNDPAAATPFFMWNGSNIQFYLTDGNNRWSAKESYLVKITSPSGALKLLDPHFKFEWSDHFDAQGASYLYSGREAGESNGAVYLRDLKTGHTRELVPPDPNNSNSFSIPLFFGEDVIYSRSNCLWEIGRDGHNNRRLFPP